MLSEGPPIDMPRPGDERPAPSADSVLGSGEPGDGVSLFSSSASWLEDSFEVDASDVLLGSFTCALKRGILLQGRLFVVAGERGGPRLLFHSSLFRRVTTLEVPLADVRAVEKKNSAGALSAIRLRLGDSGEALVFCSLLYRENAYRCVREAWRRAAPPSTRALPPEPTPQPSPVEPEQPPPPPSPSRRSRKRNLRRSRSEPPADFAAPRGVSFAPGGEDGKTQTRVLRVEFPAHDPETVFHALFDPAGALLTKHLRENCGATELVNTSFKLARAPSPSLSASRERFISYSAPTSYKFPNMPKRCEVRDLQEYTMFFGASGSEEGAAYFEMRSAAAMRGAPFAECFAVASLVRVSRDARNETSGAVVEVSCDIDWKKPVNGLLRGLIVKGARESLRRSYEKFTAMCSRELSERSPEETARATRRGARAFRRGRAASTDSMLANGAASFDADASFSTIGPDARPTRRARNAERSSASLARPDPTGGAAKEGVADDACLGVSPDASWMIPAVILVVTFAAVALYLLSLWGHDANESALRDAVADVSARRLLVHAPGFLKETIRERNDSRTLFTRRFVRDALESAAADEALVDAVARFLNDEAER